MATLVHFLLHREIKKRMAGLRVSLGPATATCGFLCRAEIV
jgi:hypothetical protein